MQGSQVSPWRAVLFLVYRHHFSFFTFHADRFGKIIIHASLPGEKGCRYTSPIGPYILILTPWLCVYVCVGLDSCRTVVSAMTLTMAAGLSIIVSILFVGDDFFSIHPDVVIAGFLHPSLPTHYPHVKAFSPRHPLYLFVISWPPHLSSWLFVAVHCRHCVPTGDCSHLS